MQSISITLSAIARTDWRFRLETRLFIDDLFVDVRASLSEWNERQWADVYYT